MSHLDESYSRDLELSQLLGGIASGQIGLPNFQRDFDWNEPDVASLLATVFSGWPAGSLLVMVGQPDFFELRGFEGAPTLGPNPQYVVLDGQQRLTSLYHALNGAGKKIWCLWVKRVLDRDVDAELIEDALVAFEVSKFESVEIQASVSSGDLLPLHFAANAADFYEWRDRTLGGIELAHRAEVSENLTRLFRNVISTAHSYKFPAMMLQNSLEPPAIARIFERINKTGMRLSIFDLLVARSYARGWNLRDVWLEARDQEPLLLRFCGDDGLAVIQALALHRMRDIRRAALLRLEAETIRTEWGPFLGGVVSAARFLKKVGAPDVSWLAYPTQLIPLAALAVDHDLEAYRGLILSWLWGSSFTGAYAVASSTVAAEDYDRLRRAMADSLPWEPYELSYSALRNATKQNNGAAWRAMRLFLRAGNAQDLLSGRSLKEASATEIEMESLMPRIDGYGGQVPFSRSVLSQVLADRSALRQMRSRPIALRIEGDISAPAWESQLLHGITTSLLIESPEATLESRFTTLFSRLKSMGAVKELSKANGN